MNLISANETGRFLFGMQKYAKTIILANHSKNNVQQTCSFIPLIFNE
ncbi:MAG: hypothetical protein HN778_17175 [Prolixibacteraceae bacterium]|nr:hypothetical protein [Prolixibacteraceae bacterium]MBT6005121.1 hypothetical protein [Prolixibacteraceae bacterium]MBT6764326.1 hypothetical protein [Prolixibacteraceae bacterium]MBT6999868.1 hypothetical protein [Prolixibacteraceae bacterium]MBT7396563.1 hypothetical protein [Prolixibacteraceae bacterium]